jgi:26S proteasome regulatory subunit N2
MFQRCIEDKEYKQAIGIALEARKLDVLERIIAISSDHSLKSYVLDVCLDVVQNATFRMKVRDNSLF